VPELTLFETMTTYADGRTRPRLQCLSEKMMAGENPIHAARRGIEEELASALTEEELASALTEEELASALTAPPADSTHPNSPEQPPPPSQRIEMLDDTLYVYEETQSGRAFPGLRSMYKLFRVDANVHGLPDGDFHTHEYYDDHGTSHPLTPSHALSRPLTPSHALSHPLTPSHALPRP
jgi:hypothetical protein